MAKAKQPRDNKAAQLSEHSKRRGAYTQEDLAVERGKLKIKKAQLDDLNVERVQHNQKKAQQKDNVGMNAIIKLWGGRLWRA